MNVIVDPKVIVDPSALAQKQNHSHLAFTAARARPLGRAFFQVLGCRIKEYGRSRRQLLHIIALNGEAPDEPTTLFPVGHAARAGRAGEGGIGILGLGSKTRIPSFRR